MGASTSTAVDTSHYLRPQTLVPVGDGRRINIYCSGNGSPTVVLDAAVGSTMYVWHNVQPEVSRRVRVCSYDRPGYGFSDPGGLPHTTSANVEDLHALLRNARIAPPYVLVAHSLNAFDARLFADRYRSELAGMVLVEPSEVGEARFAAIYGRKKLDADMAANLKFIQSCDQKAKNHKLRTGDDCVGPRDSHVSRRLDQVQQQHATSAGMWDAVLSEMSSLPTDLREVTTAQNPYGNLPLMVLTAEDVAKQQGGTALQIASAKRLWKQLRDADAALSNLGVNCVILGVSHYMQIDKPDVVIAAVLETVRHSGTSSKPSCAQLK